MEKWSTKTSVNLTTALTELVFFSSTFLVRRCPTFCITDLQKAVGEANSHISRKMLHKSVQILADDVVMVGRYENIFRDGFNKLEMAAQKMGLMIMIIDIYIYIYMCVCVCKETTCNSIKERHMTIQ